MKRAIHLLLSIFCMVAMGLVGCAKKAPLVIKESDTYIVITASMEQMDITETTTLVEYMRSLKEDGNLSFEMDDGMITSVNGIANPADWSSCWMLYTSDEENANTAWGEISYKDNVYGSAMLGAESLIIKADCLYIWVYQSF